MTTFGNAIWREWEMTAKLEGFGVQTEPTKRVSGSLGSLLIAALFIFLAFPVLAASLEQQPAEIDDMLPGKSYTKHSPALAVQSWEMAATVAFTQKPASCETAKPVDTKVTAADEKVAFTAKSRKLKQGRWSEIWTFEKCGKIVRVQADFKADGKGTADAEFFLAK